MSKDSDKGTASVQWARCWGRDACVVKRPSRYAVYGKMKNGCDLHRFYFESKCLTRNLWFPSEKRKKGISRESLALKNDETTPTFNTSCFVFLIVLKHFFYHSYSGSVCELWIYAVSPWFYLRMFLLPAEWGGKQSLPSFYTHDPSTACCNVNWGGHCSLPSVSHRKCSWGHGCRLLMASHGPSTQPPFQVCKLGHPGFPPWSCKARVRDRNLRPPPQEWAESLRRQLMCSSNSNHMDLFIRVCSQPTK